MRSPIDYTPRKREHVVLLWADGPRRLRPIYRCRACPWTGSLSEGIAHVVTNQYQES